MDCAWADRYDAAAMVARAHDLTMMLSDIEDITTPGHGTVKYDKNGMIRPSSFGTKFRTRDGSIIMAILGLTPEKDATTDDLKIIWDPPAAPRLTFELRIPHIDETVRPGLVEILSVRDMLSSIGERLLDPTLDADGPERGPDANRRITKALATILSHQTDDMAKPTLRIEAPAAGRRAIVTTRSLDHSELVMDTATIGRLQEILPECGTLHLVTLGGTLGKTYRMHPLTILETVPSERPDPVTTMRILAELGLPGIPTFDRSVRS